MDDMCRDAALVACGAAADADEARMFLAMLGVLEREPELQEHRQAMRTHRHKTGGRMCGSANEAQLHGPALPRPSYLGPLPGPARKPYVYRGGDNG